jgi:biotin operon repressor
MTVEQQIVAFLKQTETPVSRKQIAEALGLPVAHVCNPLARLKHKGIAVALPRQWGEVMRYMAVGSQLEQRRQEFISKVAKAPRFQTQGKMFIEAKFSDEARLLVK